MKEILKALRSELIANSSEERRVSAKRFFREEINPYGMKSADVTRIGKEYFKTLKGSSKADIFALCEELWKSGFLEETFIACQWSYNIHRQYTPDDFSLFERWIDRYINNWASCDTFCNHTVGEFVMMYPSFLPDLKLWAASSDRWMRRASAVSLIIPARKGMFSDHILETADILLTDKDDMVQKGYGWMLKAASQAHQDLIFGYVMSKRDVMPRTALRYAIEKMPQEMKKKAMER